MTIYHIIRENYFFTSQENFMGMRYFPIVLFIASFAICNGIKIYQNLNEDQIQEPFLDKLTLGRSIKALLEAYQISKNQESNGPIGGPIAGPNSPIGGPIVGPNSQIGGKWVKLAPRNSQENDNFLQSILSLRSLRFADDLTKKSQIQPSEKSSKNTNPMDQKLTKTKKNPMPLEDGSIDHESNSQMAKLIPKDQEEQTLQSILSLRTLRFVEALTQLNNKSTKKQSLPFAKSANAYALPRKTFNVYAKIMDQILKKIKEQTNFYDDKDFNFGNDKSLNWSKPLFSLAKIYGL